MTKAAKAVKPRVAAGEFFAAGGARRREKRAEKRRFLDGVLKTWLFVIRPPHLAAPCTSSMMTPSVRRLPIEHGRLCFRGSRRSIKKRRPRASFFMSRGRRCCAPRLLSSSSTGHFRFAPRTYFRRCDDLSRPVGERSKTRSRWGFRPIPFALPFRGHRPLHKRTCNLYAVQFLSLPIGSRFMNCAVPK